jgi:hypothetical protein
MANYEPPAETLPIFDVSVFRSTNDNVITQEEANLLYLSRQGTASSLATSTSFQGSVSCGGNLTLNAPIASSRQIEGSFLKLVDNASTSTNKPLIWYPDPSLQITTNDVVGAVKTIDLVSYSGAGTGLSTSLSCRYGRVTAQGILRVTRSTDATRFGNLTFGATEFTISNDYIGASPHLNLNTAAAGTGNVITNSPFQITNKADTTKASTITQGALNLTVSNAVASGNILLNTTTGAIVANTPFVPADVPPAIFSTRPSIGYSYSGTVAATSFGGGLVNIVTIPTVFPIGVYLFEATVTVVKGTSTFSAAGTSSSRLTYSNSAITFVGGLLSFENLFPNDTVVGPIPCGVVGGTKIMNVPVSTQTSIEYTPANWAFYSGNSTYTVYYSAVRIA